MSEEEKKADNPEVKKEDTEQKPPVKKGFLANLAKFGDFLTAKLLTPSVITVFLTAVMGPVAVKWVNDSIENKNLQKDVIKTVLSYTSEADFTKPESIEKIGIIARMVDENQGVFGLTFRETSNQIKSLNEASKDVGIKNLNKKKKEYENNIKEMELKLGDDTLLIQRLQKEKKLYSTELEQHRKNKNTQKVTELENKIAKIELDIKDATNTRDFHYSQIRYWISNKKQIELDIEQASKDLASVLEKNRQDADMLEQEKDKLKTDLANSLNEIKMLKNQIENMQNTVQIFKDSLNILKMEGKSDKKPK